MENKQEKKRHKKRHKNVKFYGNEVEENKKKKNFLMEHKERKFKIHATLTLNIQNYA